MSKAVKSLAGLMAATAVLGHKYTPATACIPVEKQKERTIRKCANPKKKAARKTKQASKRKNRR